MKYSEILNQYEINNKYKSKDIEIFVLDYAKGLISDDLMTNFIKNIYNDGLSIELTSIMTRAMMESGKIMDLSQIEGIKVDKHSTGGVGDKVSLIVAPLVSSLGGVVAKMSGRGLGFTGGTIDKLESIPGYDVSLSDNQFIENVKKHKIALIGQTDNIVPADKKIYALRDETNYIDSLPLIASSIMSKKLATGADAILLDVKCGDAAFMKTQKEAEDLAKVMIHLGKKLNKDVKVEITSMDTPLGYSIGNKNEILEAYKFLAGEKPAKDLEEVIFSSASTMLIQAKIFNNEQEALKEIKNSINSGRALKKFKEWIESQSGDYEKIKNDNFWNPKFKLEINAEKDGFLNITKAMDFGVVAMKLGAGREKKSDNIDHEAGIQLSKKTGELVEKGDLLFTLYSSKNISQNLSHELSKAYNISDDKKNKKNILKKL